MIWNVSLVLSLLRYYVWEGEDGKTYIKGAPRPKIEEMFWEPDFQGINHKQVSIFVGFVMYWNIRCHSIFKLYQGIFPYWPRHKMHMKGNYRLNMKAEFLCFFIPTVIIFGLVMPYALRLYCSHVNILDEVVSKTCNHSCINHSVVCSGSWWRSTPRKKPSTPPWPSRLSDVNGTFCDGILFFVFTFDMLRAKWFNYSKLRCVGVL